MNLLRLANRYSRGVVVLVASLVAWWLSTGPTWAAGLLPACAENGDCSLCDVVDVFINFAALIVDWLGVLAILMFIIGGVWIILAAGNPEKVKRGRQIIFGALGGALLVVSGWVIINFALAALLNADFKSVTLFPTSTSDSGSTTGGDKWYELACNPVYSDCSASGVTNGAVCSTSACTTHCVCEVATHSCVSYCAWLADAASATSPFKEAVCKTASTCESTYNAIDYWCPNNISGDAQVCCYPPK